MSERRGWLGERIVVDADVVARNLAALEGSREWRIIRVSPEIMRVMVDLTCGTDCEIAWGEPDEFGAYEPTITKHSGRVVP